MITKVTSIDRIFKRQNLFPGSADHRDELRFRVMALKLSGRITDEEVENLRVMIRSLDPEHCVMAEALCEHLWANRSDLRQIKVNESFTQEVLKYYTIKDKQHDADKR